MLIILLKLQNEFKNLNFHVVFFNQFNFAFFYQIHVEFYNMDTKNKNYSYKKINKQKIDASTPEVRKIIFG